MIIVMFIFSGFMIPLVGVMCMDQSPAGRTLLDLVSDHQITYGVGKGKKREVVPLGFRVGSV